MSKIIGISVAVATVLLAVTSAATAASSIGHDRFTSDPYADNWCGIDGSSVDRVIANYTADGSRASINIVTTFTATVSGKSMEIHQTGIRKSSDPIDNGNGTYSILFTSAGQSPTFYLPDGEVIHDTGFLEAVATFDAATDDFLSFEVVKQAGPRPGACGAIIAALS
jgi:hypothetical protein